MILCSDGGAIRHSNSYRWAIATDTLFLWECSGTATGWFVYSFRSEGIGRLALLVFLEAFPTYYQLLKINPPVRLEPFSHTTNSSRSILLSGSTTHPALESPPTTKAPLS